MYFSLHPWMRSKFPNSSPIGWILWNNEAIAYVGANRIFVHKLQSHSAMVKEFLLDSRGAQ